MILSPSRSLPSMRALQRGFTLLELMISSVIGLVLIAGITLLMQTSSLSLRDTDIQTEMSTSARIALDTIAADVNHAGYFGRMLNGNLIDGGFNSPNRLPNAEGDCSNGLYVDFRRYLFASNTINPFENSCLGGDRFYKRGTDVLIIRYAREGNLDSIPNVGQLRPNGLYVYGGPTGAEVFRGNNPPAIEPQAPRVHPDVQNRFYEVVYHVYYVSEHTDLAARDEHPSLRRLVLDDESTALFRDELVAPGIEEFRVELGVENCSTALVDVSGACDGAYDGFQHGQHGFFGAANVWPDPDSVSKIRNVGIVLVATHDRLAEAYQNDGQAWLSVTRFAFNKSIQFNRAEQLHSRLMHIRNTEPVFGRPAP